MPFIWIYFSTTCSTESANDIPKITMACIREKVEGVASLIVQVPKASRRISQCMISLNSAKTLAHASLENYWYMLPWEFRLTSSNSSFFQLGRTSLSMVLNLGASIPLDKLRHVSYSKVRSNKRLRSSYLMLRFLSIACCPNWVVVRLWRGVCFLYGGIIVETIPFLTLAA